MVNILQPGESEEAERIFDIYIYFFFHKGFLCFVLNSDLMSCCQVVQEMPSGLQSTSQMQVQHWEPHSPWAASTCPRPKAFQSITRAAWLLSALQPGTLPAVGALPDLGVPQPKRRGPMPSVLHWCGTDAFGSLMLIYRAEAPNALKSPRALQAQR